MYKGIKSLFSLCKFNVWKHFPEFWGICWYVWEAAYCRLNSRSCHVRDPGSHLYLEQVSCLPGWMTSLDVPVFHHPYDRDENGAWHTRPSCGLNVGRVIGVRWLWWSRGGGGGPAIAAPRDCVLYCSLEQTHELGTPLISDTGSRDPWTLMCLLWGASQRLFCTDWRFMAMLHW